MGKKSAMLGSFTNEKYEANPARVAHKAPRESAIQKNLGMLFDIIFWMLF
jgi:hypothetical protein